MEPAEFSKLMKKRDLESRTLLSEHYQIFKKMYANHKEYTGNELPEISMIDMLNNFCEENPIDSNLDPVKVLSDAGHLKIAEAINKVLLLR